MYSARDLELYERFMELPRRYLGSAGDEAMRGVFDADRLRDVAEGENSAEKQALILQSPQTCFCQVRPLSNQLQRVLGVSSEEAGRIRLELVALEESLPTTQVDPDEWRLSHV